MSKKSQVSDKEMEVVSGGATRESSTAAVDRALQALEDGYSIDASIAMLNETANPPRRGK